MRLGKSCRPRQHLMLISLAATILAPSRAAAWETSVCPTMLALIQKLASRTSQDVQTLHIKTTVALRSLAEMVRRDQRSKQHFRFRPIQIDANPFVDNIWASLVYCNGTSNKWTCCGGDGNYPSFVDVCYCQDNSPAAFHAASTLNQMASLPYTASVAPSSSASSSADVRVATPTTRTSSSASGTTSSAASTASTASNKPSSTSALPSSSQVSTSDSKSQATTSSTAAASSDGTSSASSTTAGAPSTVSSSGASAPSQVTTSPSPSGSVVPAAGMSMGTKIGLGVGIAGGVLFIAALVMLALVWRKRRQGPQSSQYANGTPDYGIEHKDWKGNDGGAVSAFGTKAELEAPERAPASPQMMKTELSGDSARSPGPRTPAPEYREFGTPRPADDAVYEMPGHQR
ncbi:MAG: hypothetical protein M1812_003339 [Candelaria pacifica]|nr:MAG: hypothetical protein M1812_003339 [Candelaria pacifica]